MNNSKKANPLVLLGIAVGIIFIVLLPLLLCLWRSSEAYRRNAAGLHVPEYSGQPYVEVNGNVPFFEEEDLTLTSFERYSKLDLMGRCGPAFANVSRELMPTEERGPIGSIKPTGWEQAKYEGIVDANPPYLYNRCHLTALAQT